MNKKNLACLILLFLSLVSMTVWPEPKIILQHEGGDIEAMETIHPLYFSSLPNQAYSKIQAKYLTRIFSPVPSQPQLDVFFKLSKDKLTPLGTLIVKDYFFESSPDKQSVVLKDERAKHFVVTFLTYFFSAHRDFKGVSETVRLRLTQYGENKESILGIEVLMKEPGNFVDYSQDITIIAPANFLDYLQSRILMFSEWLHENPGLETVFEGLFQQGLWLEFEGDAADSAITLLKKLYPSADFKVGNRGIFVTLGQAMGLRANAEFSLAAVRGKFFEWFKSAGRQSFPIQGSLRQMLQTIMALNRNQVLWLTPTGGHLSKDYGPAEYSLNMMHRNSLYIYAFFRGLYVGDFAFQLKPKAEAIQLWSQYIAGYDFREMQQFLLEENVN